MRLTQKTTNNSQQLWCDCTTFPTQDSCYVQEEGYAWRRKASFPPRRAPVGERKARRDKVENECWRPIGRGQDKLADTVAIKLLHGIV